MGPQSSRLSSERMSCFERGARVTHTGLLWLAVGLDLVVGSYQGKGALLWVKERQGCLPPALLPSPIHTHPKGHQAASRRLRLGPL